MFRHQARIAVSQFVQRWCGGSDNLLCKFATEDISWFTIPILLVIIAIAVLYYANSKKQLNLMQQKAKERHLTLDKRAMSVYEAIQEFGTTDPKKIVALGNKQENAAMWIAGLDEDRVREITKQLIAIEYLSNEDASNI